MWEFGFEVYKLLKYFHNYKQQRSYIFSGRLWNINQTVWFSFKFPAVSIILKQYVETDSMGSYSYSILEPHKDIEAKCDYEASFIIILLKWQHSFTKM